MSVAESVRTLTATNPERGREDCVERRLLRIGDAEIECFVHGEGSAIVLLPGESLAVGYLSDLAEAIATAGFRAIRVNPRGAGASTGPMVDLTLHDLAAEVAGVIGEEGQPCHW